MHGPKPGTESAAVNAPENDALKTVAPNETPVPNAPAAVTGAADPDSVTGLTPLPPPSEPASTYCLTRPQHPEELGRLGPYRILQQLGTGGMGIVFLAEDTMLGRRVALKTMLPVIAADPQARERFLREARAVASIEHEHIVPIFQVGEENGVPYLAMPLLRGESLDHRLAREGKLPVGEAIRIAREMAEGLGAAHEVGLIHRDIKPANVWLMASPGCKPGEGRVKLLDFGLARVVNDETHITREGTILGTPAYMAPEQALGQPVDPRSDLYSLGCVLYRLVTGVLPFPTSNVAALLLAITTETARPASEHNPEVPKSLNDLITRLLARDPANRPATAAAVVEELAGIERNLAAPRTPEPLPPPQPALPRRRTRWPLAVAASLLFLGGGALLAPWILRIISKDGTIRELTISPGDKIEVVENPAAPAPGDKFPAPPSPAASTPSDAPLDTLRREDIPVEDLAAAGAGDPTQAPPGLVAVLRTGGGPLGDMAFRPDGKRLAVCAGRNHLQLWDLTAGPMQRTLTGQMDRVMCVAFSPDGKWLASGHLNSSVVLWEAATAKPVVTLEGHKDAVTHVAFSPSGKVLATASCTTEQKKDGRQIKLWDMASHKELHMLAGPGGGGGPQRGTPLAFTPDGRWLASGHGDGSVNLWAVGTWEQRTLGQLSGAVTSLSVGPDSKLLAVGDVVGNVIVWEVATGQERRRLPREGPGGVPSVAFSPDGKTLAIVLGARLQLVRLWDLAGNKPGMDVAYGGSLARRCLFSPEGRHLAINCQEGVYILRLVPPSTGRENPFVLVRAGGGPRVEFKDLAGALEVLQDGDAVEVHGNGPYTIGSVKVTGKHWTLRAGPGYRPQFVTAQSVAAVRAWFWMIKGSLHLQGCDFHCTVAPQLRAFIADGGGPWEVRNCRFIASGAQLFGLWSDLRMQDSLILVAGSSRIFALNKAVKLELENNVISHSGTDEYHLIGLEGGIQSVRLVNNTFFSTSRIGNLVSVLVQDSTVPDPEPATVHASGNLIRVNNAIRLPLAVNNQRYTPDWKGDHNLYLKGGLKVRHPDGKITDDLAGWGNRFGQAEEGSRLVDRVVFQWEEKGRAAPPEDPLLWQLSSRSPGYRQGRDGKDYGADVSRVARRSGSAPVTPPSRTTDREKPFVLLRGGKPAGEYQGFAGALNAMQDGDVIEIHGNGPFAIGGVYLIQKGLHLRAGAGYRPKLVPNADAQKSATHFIVVQNASLTVEGCDLEVLSGSPHALLTGGGAPWRLQNCRLVMGPNNVALLISYDGPRLTVADSLLVQYGSHSCIGLGGKAEAEFTNNVIYSAANTTIGFQPPAAGHKLTLRNNSFLSRPSAILTVPSVEKEPPGPVTVIAEGNLFDCAALLRLSDTDLARSQAALAKVNWMGRDNHYAIAKTRGFAIDSTQLVVKDLEAWNKHLGKPEEGSKWSESADYAFLPPAARRGPGALSILRDRLARADVGPDWSLVGPGDAYVAALEARGDKPQLRPAPHKDGPVVLIRNGKEVSGHETVTRARVMAQNGDVIEVRTDDPIEPQGDHIGKQLTFRVAPGYRPVVIGPFGLHPEAVYSFEGFTFRKYLGSDHFVGTVRRLVNCSFDAEDGWALMLGEASDLLEIENCRISGQSHIRLKPETKVRCVNSLLGPVTFNLTKGEQTRELDLDRCLLWSEWLGYGVHSAAAPGGLAVSARRCWFETPGGVLVGTVKQLRLTWRGEENVYAVGGSVWAYQPEMTENLIGLAAWRKHFGGDADSTSVEPLFYDARGWRTPGEPKFGAAVDRVATPAGQRQ